ncbi:hypothetical protein EJ04DRAFT_549544 [Polyplosphaeria fusca]|uniref:Uncharacterized protein n=1 Tax=Polyplosphaeria fusca TaxID=682080 RepID=A0A9P4R8G4_9PLEO|nr:hypothetical protein EJ04DRAFT_549544 [Polyplosphaeria fusca]
MSSSFSQSTVPSKRKAQSGGSLAREKHHLKHQQANAHKPKPPGSTVTDLEKFVWDTLDEHPGHAFASPAACKIADAYKKTHQYRRKEAEWLQRLANKANTPQGWTAPHVQAMEQTLSGYSITKSEIESLVEEQTHQPATEEDAQPAIGDRMDDDAEVPTIPQSGDGGHGNASKEIIFIIDQDLATTEAEFRFTKKIVAKINESLKLHGLHRWRSIQGPGALAVQNKWDKNSDLFYARQGRERADDLILIETHNIDARSQIVDHLVYTDPIIGATIEPPETTPTAIDPATAALAQVLWGQEN